MKQLPDVFDAWIFDWTSSNQKVSEPLCWGMDGVPLLPRAWLPELRQITTDMSFTGRKRGRVPASVLVDTNWFHEVSWSNPPAQLASDIATQMMMRPRSGASPHELIDRISTSWAPIELAEPQSCAHVPLLVETWRDLETCGINLPTAIQLLNAGATDLLLEKLSDAASFLDIFFTTPQWLSQNPLDRHNNWLHLNQQDTFVTPATPADWEGAIQLAQIRHIKMAGGAKKHVEPETSLPMALGMRCGISLHPSDTLEAAGLEVGLTRERMRQITQALALAHNHHRKWPIPKFLQEIRPLIDLGTGNRIESVFESVAQHLPQGVPEKMRPSTAIQRVVAVLNTYGADIQLPEFGGQHFIQSSPNPWPRSWDASRAMNIAKAVSNGSGLGLVDELRQSFAATDPELTLREIDDLVERATARSDLPLNYFLVARPRHPVFASTTHQILSALRTLDITELRIGLQRRFTFRNLGVVPPNVVMLTALRAVGEFEITGNSVALTSEPKFDGSTISAWILSELRNAPGQVLHREVLMERAEAHGLKQSSVGMYTQYGAFFKTASRGSGCITVLGHKPTANDIGLAKVAASAIRQPSRVETRNFTDHIEVTITVGTTFLFQGVISVGNSVTKRIGNRKFSFEDTSLGEGKIAVSGSNLYGMGTALGIIGASVGDQVRLELDLARQTAKFQVLNEGQ